MTSHKQLKARIRVRMARTGERYTTARRHVLGDPPVAGTRVPAPVNDAGYLLHGGVHPETASIANALANQGVTAGHTGEPLTEAMVLGIGGGLGAGYILWEFAAHHARTLVLGFRNQWQYPAAWVTKTADRLGVPHAVHETAGAKGAAARLDGVLAARRLAIVTVDREPLGYWHLPAFLSGHGGNPVVAYATTGGRVHVDDRNTAPLTVDRAALDAARGRVVSYRNRLVTLEPAGPVLDAGTLRAAVRAGLADQVSHLSAGSASFSLPAWRKWARMTTDRKNAKGWPRVFADQRGLVGALLSIYEGVTPAGPYGGNLRGLYADFLDEAAGLLGDPRLGAVAALARDAAGQWHELADIALPPGEPVFAELRELTAAVHAGVVGDGDKGASAAGEAAARLWSLRERYDDTAPLDAEAVAALFGRIGAQVADIYAAETALVRKLAVAVG
jgi:hypothetical protein